MKKYKILPYNKWVEEDEESIQTEFQGSKSILLVLKFKGEKNGDNN
jgi:hypothetical protein